MDEKNKIGKKKLTIKKLGKKLKIQRVTTKKKTRKKIKIKQMKPCTELIEQYKETHNSELDINSLEYQQFLKCMTTKERNSLEEHGEDFEYLYPNKNDGKFNLKIA